MKRLIEILAAVAVAVWILDYQIAADPVVPDLPYAESQAYFNVAMHIYHHGTYSQDPNLDEKHPPPGRYFAPLYPSMVALLMKLDPRFAETVECTIRYRYKLTQKETPGYDPADPSPPHCPMNADILFGVQAMLSLIVLVATYCTARLISCSRLCAGLTMLLAAFIPAFGFDRWSPYFYPIFIRAYLTDILYIALYSLAALAAVYAVTRRSAKAGAACGALLALTALTKPQYFYLYYAALFLLAVCGLTALYRNRWRLRPLWQDWRVRAGLGFALSFAAVMGPWLIRNHLRFGDFALTESYAGMILSQRIGYYAMNAHEFWWSFIFWLPSWGPHITLHLLGSNDSLIRLVDWQTPESFVRAGLEQLLPAANEAAAKLKMTTEMYFLRHDILPHFLTHLKTTLPLLWRGVLYNAYFAPFLFLFFLGMLADAARTRWASYLIYALPPLFMLVFQAMVSLNVVRYNVILYPPMAFAVAYGVTRLMQRVRA